MTITLLLLLSAGLLVMAYLLCTLHSRLRLLERTSSTLKRQAMDIAKMHDEACKIKDEQMRYFQVVSGQQHDILGMISRFSDFTLKLAEKVLTKGEYQAPTAKPVTLGRVPRPLRTKPVMNPQPTTDK
nr:MAG TPA: interact CLIP, MHC2 interacting [Caudoviricetes sp.]